MPVKIATFNLENLFTRPVAMNSATDAAGTAAIEDHAMANKIANKATYSATDKAKLVTLSKKYGWHLKFPPKKLVLMQKVRGKLFKQPTGGDLTVVANGRSDWVGWFELRKEDVTWEATFNTARVIAETAPDILILVEVENRPTFKRFDDQVLKESFGMQFNHFLVIDGNDERGIDVGIASRFPIKSVISHVDEPYADESGRLFSRDCPEYEISLAGGKSLVILPNHFKSKRSGNDEASTLKRTAQAKRTLEIAKSAATRADYVLIGGDLNDTPDSEAMLELLKDGFVDVNDHADYPVDRPGTYNTGTASSKIDYLIMSAPLRGKLLTTGIERRGSFHPRTWTPFDTVTSATTEASDHHLVWATFDI